MGRQVLFTGLNLLYHQLYASEAHFYLSTLFQTDKYGIVFNYSVLSLIMIMNRFQDSFIRCFQLHYPNRVKVTAELAGCCRSNVWILLKCFFLGNIFMFNTSDDVLHATAHVTFVGTFIIVSGVSSFLYHIKAAPPTGPPASSKVAIAMPVVLGATYLYFSKVAKHPFLSLLFESLALGATLDDY